MPKVLRKKSENLCTNLFERENWKDVCVFDQLRFKKITILQIAEKKFKITGINDTEQAQITLLDGF